MANPRNTRSNSGNSAIAEPTPATPATPEATAPTATATIEDEDETTVDSSDVPAGFVPLDRVRMLAGDRAVFVGTGRGKGTDSIRIGEIVYATSSPSFTSTWTVYRKVQSVPNVATDPNTKGGKITLSIAKGMDLDGGIDRKNPELLRWLETETLAWIAWYRVHGKPVAGQPVAAAAQRFDGVSADDI